MNWEREKTCRGCQHPPDLSLQSAPTEETPDVGLNPNGCALPLLLHEPFLASLTGSVDEPRSRGLRDGEHVRTLAQTLQGKWRLVGADHCTKRTHRKQLTSNGSGPSSTSQRANGSPGTSPSFLSALLMQLPKSRDFFPVFINHVFLRERAPRLA